MDGYQICKRLKRDQNTAHIPVIMLAAADNSQAAVEGLDSSADDYILKDAFATNNLIATLRTYLNFKQAFTAQQGAKQHERHSYSKRV